MKIFNVSVFKLLQIFNLILGINIGGSLDILMGYGFIYMYDVIIIIQYNFVEVFFVDFKIWF